MSQIHHADPAGHDGLHRFLEHADWLQGLARALVRDGHEAEDVFQEALIAASGGSPPAGVPVRAWLGGVVKNVARGRRRQRSLRSEREQIVAAETQRGRSMAGAPAPLAEAQQLELQRRMLDHVESLPEGQRSAVLARFYEGLPPRKIAQRDGVSVSTVNSRLQRAMEVLRGKLDVEHGDRRAWALWILPLARRAPVTKLSSAAWVLGAVGAALVLAGGVALLSGLRDDPGSEDPLERQAWLTPEDLGATTALPAAGVPADRVELEPIFVAESSSAEPAPSGPQLVVRVNDADGEVVDSGVTIGANVRVEMPGRPGLLSADHVWFDFEGLADGQASFGNVFQGTEVNGMEQSPGTWDRFLVDAVFIEGPGLAEFEQGASKSVSFLPLRPASAEIMECALVLPPRGAVRLDVSGPDGQRLDADGMAYLVFDGVGHLHDGGERTYEAVIESGAAEWPNFATGSRPFSVRVVLPELGASWSVAGRGPERADEVVTITTLRPKRPAITARLLDESGEPLELEVVQLKPTHRPDYPFMGRSVRASSDVAGQIRFELPEGSPETGPLPSFALHALSSSLEGEDGHYRQVMHDGVRLFESPQGSYAMGMDLGDVTMRLEKRARVEGRVLDAAGRPIQGAEVKTSTPGIGSWAGFVTDASGRFSMETPVREGSTIRVSSPAGPYLAQERSLSESLSQSHSQSHSQGHSQSRSSGSDELTFVLVEGARFEGQLDMGGMRFPERALMILLSSTTEPGLSRMYWPDKLGAFGGGPVPEGEYTAILRHQGGQTMAEIDGLRFEDGEVVSDERLNGVRLTDHYRRVEVTCLGIKPGARVDYIVEPVGGSRPGAFILIGTLEDGLLLPTRLEASVRLTCHPNSARIADISTIGDTLEVKFGDPVEFLVRVEGQPDALLDYSLRGSAGSDESGFSVSLPRGALSSGEVLVRVPGPGVYGVVSQAIPRPVSGGAVFQATTRTPIGDPFMIQRPKKGASPQVVSIRL